MTNDYVNILHIFSANVNISYIYFVILREIFGGLYKLRAPSMCKMPV